MFFLTVSYALVAAFYLFFNMTRKPKTVAVWEPEVIELFDEEYRKQCDEMYEKGEWLEPNSYEEWEHSMWEEYDNVERDGTFDDELAYFAEKGKEALENKEYAIAASYMSYTAKMIKESGR